VLTNGAQRLQFERDRAMFNDTHDVISFDATLQGDQDGTGSPYLDNSNYAGKRDDIIFGGVLGTFDPEPPGTRFGLDDFGTDSPLDSFESDLDFFDADFFAGADEHTTDLSVLGIDTPMVWGSSYPDATGWDELGQDDIFGWSPITAVKNAVKKVGTKAPTVAVKKIAVAAKAPAKPAVKAPAKPSVGATLAKSNIVKKAGTGAALSFPAVGASMATGIAAAAALAAAVKSKVASQAAAAKQVVLNTHKLATTPGPDQKGAQVALATMAMAANAKKAQDDRARGAQPPPPVVARPAAAPPPQPHPTTLWPNPQALPPMTPGARRITNNYGNRRVIHDILPQGHVTTFVV
jgi:hypothetical protein